MPLTYRRLRFLARWVVIYNIRLVWLNLLLPRKLHPGLAMDSAADELRRNAHEALARASEACNKACADCGRCCLEGVDRFSGFDYLVRLNSDIPAPSWDGKIYSIWWMIYNAVRHGAQRVFRRSHPETPPTCGYLTSEGCSLARVDRPMICVSWWCAQAALAMDISTMEASEPSLRAIEALHRGILVQARRAQRATLDAQQLP